jgi:hypothetical protein
MQTFHRLRVDKWNICIFSHGIMDNLHIEQMGLGKVADSSQSRVRSHPYVGHTTCDIVPRLLTLLVYEKKRKYSCREK